MSIWRSHADTNSQRRPARRRQQIRRHYDSGSDGNNEHSENFGHNLVTDGDDGDDYDDSGTDYDNASDDDDEDDEFEPPVYVQPTEWSGK